jgi:hypothetical protein
MAVERLKGMAGENEALQQRVATLESSSSSGGTEVDALLNKQRQQWQQEQAVAIQTLRQEHAVTIHNRCKSNCSSKWRNPTMTKCKWMN